MTGFVDIHCHGGGGGDLASADDASIRRAADFHAAHGTQSVIASLVTASVPSLLVQVSALADVIDSGDTIVDGIHLEGPWLSSAQCGAHDPTLLALPSLADLARLIESARGHLRMLTIAPELPGALPVISAAVSAGVTIAVGHTNASYDVCCQAFSAGATVATHLFNQMTGLHHRNPGAVGAALDSGVFCELIVDGFHLHDAVVRSVFAQSDRVVLMTDSMSAAGLPDGSYELGGIPVTVADGAARLTSSGALAGSVLTMDRAVERVIALGIDPARAHAAATTNPRSAIQH